MSKLKLDKVFSQFIRLRDADNNGFCRCISCGCKERWQDVDCGHFVNRHHMATRYDERNCNAQCRKCNRFTSGNIEGYKRGMIRKYGIEIIEELEDKKHEIHKMSKADYEIAIEYYRGKVNELMKEKL